MESKLIIRTLHYLSSSYLRSAAILSEKCLEIEQNISVSSRSKLIEEHKAYFYGAIFNCVSYLESYINEIYVDISEGNFYGIKIDGKSINQIQELWNLRIPRTAAYRTIEKYQIFLILANKSKMDKSKKPYQDVDQLIKLRNSLIHYEPEYIQSTFKNQNAELHKYQKYLQDKITVNPFASVLDDFYPTKIISHGCCDWAINSTKKFIEEFEGKLLKNSG